MSRSHNLKCGKVSVSQRKTLVSPSRKVSILPFVTPIIILTSSDCCTYLNNWIHNNQCMYKFQKCWILHLYLVSRKMFIVETQVLAVDNYEELMFDYSWITLNTICFTDWMHALYTRLVQKLKNASFTILLQMEIDLFWKVCFTILMTIFRRIKDIAYKNLTARADLGRDCDGGD